MLFRSQWAPKPILLPQLISDRNTTDGPTFSANPREWNTEQVCVWLRFSGLNEETRRLTSRYLRETNKNVLDLDAQDAKSIGIVAFSQRKLLLKRIEELRTAGTVFQ